jgi:flagellar basal-body rod protein FlgB
MFFGELINRGTIPGLEKTLSFIQARHRTLVENIANVDTPGYKTKHLDVAKFQASLQEAFAQRREKNSTEFAMPGSDQFKQQADGSMKFKPSVEPAENILFHDQTNMRIEQQMAKLAENAMMQENVAELLRSRYSRFNQVIRGQVS